MYLLGVIRLWFCGTENRYAKSFGERGFGCARSEIIRFHICGRQLH